LSLIINNASEHLRIFISEINKVLNKESSRVKHLNYFENGVHLILEVVLKGVSHLLYLCIYRTTDVVKFATRHFVQSRLVSKFHIWLQAHNS